MSLLSAVKLKVLGVGCWSFLWHASVCQLWLKLTNQMTQNLKLTHSGQRSEMKLQKVKQVLRGFRWLLWQPISRGYNEVDTQMAPGPCYSALADCYWQTVSRCSAVTFTASHWNIKEMQAQRRKKPLCTWGGIKSSTEYSVWPFVSNIVLQSWFSTSFCVCSEKVECTRSLICAHEDFKKGMVKVGVLLSCLKEHQKASKSDGCDLCPTQRSSLKKRRWHFLRVCIELGCDLCKMHLTDMIDLFPCVSNNRWASDWQGQVPLMMAYAPCICWYYNPKSILWSLRPSLILFSIRFIVAFHMQVPMGVKLSVPSSLSTFLHQSKQSRGKTAGFTVFTARISHVCF